MRRRTLFQLLGALLLLLGIAGAYGGWYAVVRTQSAEAARLLEEVRVKSEDSARLKAAREALERIANDENAVTGYLVRQEDIVAFLGTLEQAGSTMGAVVEVESVSAETEGARDAIVLSLSIRGSFDAVLRTVGAIEYGPYDSSITSLTLDSVATDEGRTGTWNASVTARFGMVAEGSSQTP